MGYNYSLSLSNASDDDIEAAFRQALAKYEPKRRSCWPRSFWADLPWGAAIIAAMDHGDIWICAGQCQAVIDAARTAGGQ